MFWKNFVQKIIAQDSCCVIFSKVQTFIKNEEKYCGAGRVTGENIIYFARPFHAG
jgi:hypothetical protein